jgi:hypothetical protein
MVVSVNLLGLSLFASASELPAQDRLKSCNQSIEVNATVKISSDLASLKTPLTLFSPAPVFFRHGKKDDGVDGSRFAIMGAQSLGKGRRDNGQSAGSVGNHIGSTHHLFLHAGHHAGIRIAVVDRCFSARQCERKPQNSSRPRHWPFHPNTF